MRIELTSTILLVFFISSCLPQIQVPKALEENDLPITIQYSTKPGILGWLDSNGANSVVNFTLTNPTGAQGKCKFYKKNAAVPNSFSDCGTIVGTTLSVAPKLLVGSVDDGTYILDVKLSNLTTETPTLSQEVYLHTSLDNAPTCQLPLTEQDYFDLAAQHLSMASTFGNGTTLTNPIPNIVMADSTVIRPNSFRRKFVMSSDSKLILVYRAYESRKNNTCANFVRNRKSKSGSNGYSRDTFECVGMVFNADKDGVCLDYVSGSLSFVRTLRNVIRNLDEQYKGMPMFSKKVTDPSKVDSYNLYLPD